MVMENRTLRLYFSLLKKLSAWGFNVMRCEHSTDVVEALKEQKQDAEANWMVDQASSPKIIARPLKI
uniref:Uncharacterized protein n=1 Tax=Physcomitrium patens TaxID=3218 RepID=A0A2K1KWF7_PHYPA|nr:hypothetical protein PHYPA_005117 [Physcomitrium patens]